MFAWPCIIDRNNTVEDQLDATITIYWYSSQLNIFGQFFTHPQVRKTVFYSLLYNAPKCTRTHSQCLRVQGYRPATTWVHYTTSCKTQSCAPEDGQKIARKCWAAWNINKLLLLHLVGSLHYYLYGKCCGPNNFMLWLNPYFTSSGNFYVLLTMHFSNIWFHVPT